MDSDIDFIRRLVAQGGPQDRDTSELDAWVVRTHSRVRAGELSGTDLADLRDAFGDALSPSTMQGFAFTKPHGYAGDFEVIDRIYQLYISPNPHLANWDRFYHQHAAPKAVRNRKTYFHSLLDRHFARRTPLRVLKIASGPGRSMFEWLSAHQDADVIFDCVEIDANAIEFASRLNHQFLDRITFTQTNALRYRPNGQYDLIWAAGIFDYFNDKVFVSLFRRLLPAIAPHGELVVGNFSDDNTSRAYMELVGNWMLNHRTPSDLTALAEQCGVQRDRITIGSESEGVNLFLHVTHPLEQVT